MKTHTYKNQNVWIIGASSGIGKALAKELHNRGATLYLSARTESKLNDLNTELDNAHHVFAVDVSKKTKIKQVSEEIFKHALHIDRIIFLAAIYEPSSIADMKITDMDKTVDVNLKGAFYLINAILPLMNKAQLALCGSIAGYRGLPNGQPYSATKAAITNLAETLRTEQQDKGLDIRLISPGFVKTPMTAKNEFDMPMAIEPEEAADAIADGLSGSSFEVHFPKRMTLLMKLIQKLPYILYFPLAKMIRDRD